MPYGLNGPAFNHRSFLIMDNTKLIAAINSAMGKMDKEAKENFIFDTLIDYYMESADDEEIDMFINEELDA
jgi:hypothetical protein